MGKINVTRVILGGLLAGLVINIGESILNLALLGDRMETALRQLGLTPVAGATIGLFVLLGFVLGILIVWLYAAVRPRFGAGPQTAILTGFFVWVFAILWPVLTNGLMGLFDADLLVVSAVWGLFEMMAASLAGAWAYREESA